MNKHFRDAGTTLDKRGNPIKIDDICRVEWPDNRMLNGLSGPVVRIEPDQGHGVRVFLNAKSGGETREVNIPLSKIVRTKLAEDTSEYRVVPRRDGRNVGGREGRGRLSSAWGASNVDILGQDQSNHAVGDALMKAIRARRDFGS